MSKTPEDNLDEAAGLLKALQSRSVQPGTLYQHLRQASGVRRMLGIDDRSRLAALLRAPAPRSTGFGFVMRDDARPSQADLQRLREIEEIVLHGRFPRVPGGSSEVER